MSNSDSDTPTPSSMDADYEKPMLNSFSIIQFARNKIQKTKTTKFSIYEFSRALFGRLLFDQTFIFTKCFTLKYSSETTKHSHLQVVIAFFLVPFRFVCCGDHPHPPSPVTLHRIDSVAKQDLSHPVDGFILVGNFTNNSHAFFLQPRAHEHVQPRVLKTNLNKIYILSCAQHKI